MTDQEEIAKMIRDICHVIKKHTDNEQVETHINIEQESHTLSISIVGITDMKINILEPSEK